MKKTMIAIMLCALLTGCSKTLSRDKAKDLIWAYSHFDEPEPLAIVPTDNELAELRKRGIVAGQNLTPLGQVFFRMDNHRLVPVAKLHPVIEVTGISGDAQEKEVEYTIQWLAELRSEVKDIFKEREPEPHSVIIQLYDDGWRVVRFER
jgi:hypothetical protein